MRQRRCLAGFRALAAGAALLGLAGSIHAASGPATRPWQDKVHPRVLQHAAAGPAEFIVFLAEQADLTPAATVADRAARGELVYRSLTETAARTQAPILAELEIRGLAHRSMWIANMIWARGDRAPIESLASRSDVLRLDSNPVVRVDEPVAQSGGRESAAAIEWGILKVMADQVWAMGFDGAGIVIGGQDTGYDWDHPALVESYRGWNGTSADHAYNWHDAIHSGGGVCGPDSSQPCDDHGHGTHTMGTMIGDDGGVNRIGIAPGARWIGCRNMDVGNGTPASYSECFQWFVAPTDAIGQNPDPGKAPHVINNSWTCPQSEGCSFDTLRTVVENTRAAGIVVVASAGNTGSGCSSVVDPPAIYDASFSIGATDSGDNIASFSARGPVTIDGSDRLKPDVSAPGVNVRSSVRGTGYGLSSGTSMAGPHVAGLVGLLLSARPDLAGRVNAIETLIETSAFPLTSGQSCGGVPGGDIPNAVFGHGRIDAVQMLLGDADADGTDNLSDCRPVDPALWSAPSSPAELQVAKLGTDARLSWTVPVDAGGSTPLYDVVRSGSGHGFATADCLVSSTPSTSLDDVDVPGSAFYYLIRVKNPCGLALGDGSDGLPRAARACLTAGG